MAFVERGEFIGFSIFMVAAIILILLGFLRRRKVWKWPQVVGVYDTESKFGLSKPKPTVRYTVDGKEFRSTSSLGQNYVPRNGRKVGLFYNPNKPEQVIIDSFIQRGDFFLLLGLFFLIIALIVFN